MGLETIALTGFAGMQYANTIKAGQAKAKAITEQAQNETLNEANDTTRATGTLRNSFLSSGLTLEGGPMAAIAQAFDVGNTNIARTAQNANNASKNTMNAARTAALTGLAKNAAMAAGGGMFDAQGVTGAGEVGGMFPATSQEVGSWFDPSPVGPYQPFGLRGYNG